MFPLETKQVYYNYKTSMYIISMKLRYFTNILYIHSILSEPCFNSIMIIPPFILQAQYKVQLQQSTTTISRHTPLPNIHQYFISPYPPPHPIVNILRGLISSKIKYPTSQPSRSPRRKKKWKSLIPSDTPWSPIGTDEPCLVSISQSRSRAPEQVQGRDKG
jgi:hypothetical protein